VRGVVVYSAGFAEHDGDGRTRQQRIVATARAAGMRLVGPNGFGIINSDPAVALNATIAPLRLTPGPLAMLSQSGAIGLAVLERCARRGLGLSSFVSVGNKADVSSNDLLAYWNEDERTRVVLLYLESFGNPRKFARVAPDVARRVPIVAVKAGRSAAGARAAAGHSAAPASLDVAADAVFAQAGVLRTDTLAEQLDVATLLATQPVPTGPRVGVVTNAGGPAVLFADAAEAAGLIPSGGPAGGAPIDLGFAVRPDDYTEAMTRLGADAAVEALAVIYATPLPSDVDAFAAAIARGAAAVPAEKPVVVVFMAPGFRLPAALHEGARGRLAAYDLPESAARALGAAARYGAWRARPPGTVLELPEIAREAIRAVVDRVRAGSSGAVELAMPDLLTVLRAAGIGCAMAECVAPAAAAATAERVGYPLVMKAEVPGLLHRRAAGAVRFDLHDADGVAHAAADFTARFPSLTAVELQRQVHGGVELFVGVRGEPTFGPLLVCGAAGAARDAALRLPPVSDLDAEALLGELARAPLAPPLDAATIDRGALCDVIRRVSALIDVVPELSELTLEPLTVRPPGEGAVVIRAVLRLG
jgi:acyl-CoA synthetase (NDP forming)